MPIIQDSNIEDASPKNVIVIHPGSLYVRIGRSLDSNPVTVLHAIARKRRGNGAVHQDPLLPSTLHRVKESTKEIEEVRLQVSRYLQSQNQSSGRRRYVTPPQQIAAYNRYRRVTGQMLSSSGGEWYQTNEEFIVGDEILNLNPEAPYNVHFPVRRGELNLHKGVSGSLTGVLEDLRTIWSYVIKYHLNIPIAGLKDYNCVLVIPDIFCRNHVKELTNLLLMTMKFNACFLVQDHVAATFGAGLNYACVIDVGHEKTSISCVEDGISLTNTRVRFSFGGADVTQTFHWLLQKCAFPYIQCNPYESRLDSFLMQKLKHEFCHMNLDVCGCYEKTFVVRQPKKPVQRFTIQVGDECIIAVLSMFHPELLGIMECKPVETHHKVHSLSEDPLDSEYLRETGRRGAKESLEGITGENLGESLGNSAPQGTGDEELMVDGIVESAQLITSTSDFVSENGTPVGIDTAVVRCIERYGCEEVRRKFYTSILLIGGGLKFPGASEFLECKVSKLISAPHQTEGVEVIMSSKEIECENTAWRGAAVMASLESAHELWIHSVEWQRHSVRLLREKSVFIW